MNKNYFNTVLALCLLFSLTGCAATATPKKTYMPISQIPNPQVIGQIRTSFEIDEKLSIGFLGGLGLGVVAVGSYMVANPNPGYEKEAFRMGSITIGAGIGFALIQDIINMGKAQRINKAARDALLEAAKQRYPEEDVEIRDVSVEYVQPSDKTHLYHTSGIVIKKEF